MFAGITSTTGMTGITGITGTTVKTVVFAKGVCSKNGEVEGVLSDVDDEVGETGVDRNKTLTGVGTALR